MPTLLSGRGGAEVQEGDTLDPVSGNPTQQNQDPRQSYEAQLESFAAVPGTTQPRLWITDFSAPESTFHSPCQKHRAEEACPDALRFFSPSERSAPTSAALELFYLV